MTRNYWIIRFKRKAHKKARWKRAKTRMFNRDPKWLEDQELIKKWVEEA